MIKINTNYIKYIILIIFLICLFAFQKTNYICIQTTITLFLNSVMPSLFPFILFTNILIQGDVKNIVTKISKKYGYLLYATLIGFLCGYPSGAKIVQSLYDENAISKKQAKFLMTFCNNANPIFILSTIGICVLDNMSIALLLLICHYLSSIIICIYEFTHMDIIHDNEVKSNSLEKKTSKKLHKSVFEIIDSSIKNTFIVLGTILGYILFFNLLFSMINVVLVKINIPKNIIFILSGIFESTKGINDFYLNSNYSFNITIALISFILSFSGLSIIFQIYSSIIKTGISIIHILKYKIIQGVLSAILTIFSLNICNFSYSIKKLNINQFNANIYYLIIVCLLFILIYAIKKVTRKN